jgi:glutathione synthase/RimK-type ligase-like ATP-grasp enzyme
MNMKVKNYIYAGLDFIFDKEGHIWFIEANGCTRGFVEYRRLYKSTKPVKELAKSIKKNGKRNCVLISKKEKYYRGSASNKWLYQEIGKHTKLHACYIEDNKKRKKDLVDVEGRKIKPSSLLVHDYYNFNNTITSKTKTVNNIELVRFVKNKFKTFDLIKKKTKIKTPRTFIVRNNKELKKILDKHIFHHGYVVKPIIGGEGTGVVVVGDHEKMPRIRQKMLVQERVIPKLIHKKYWDVRIFVINGKLCGGFMRESIHRVTNICRGGKAHKIPKKILSKLKKPSLEIVSAIEKNFKKEG